MTREEALEFIAQSVKSDVDMAKVADALEALEQELVMKITVIEYGDIEHHRSCVSFEFRTNQVENWLKIKYQDGSKEIIHGVATIKAESEVKK